MKKIIIGLVAISLGTQLFALSANDSMELKGFWSVEKEKVHATTESMIYIYTTVVNSEIRKSSIQKVCTDIDSFAWAATSNIGKYDRWYGKSPKGIYRAANIRAYSEEFMPVCKQYVSNYVGSEINLSLSDSSGVSSTFTTTQYCSNYTSYIRHIEPDSDLKLAFATFTSRLPSEKLDIITKISENKTEIKAHALITNLSRSHRIKNPSEDYIVFSTMPFIDIYFNRNNKSSKKGIGGNDLELKQFIAAIISKNYYKADKILERHMKESKKIVTKAQWICDKTTIYN